MKTLSIPKTRFLSAAFGFLFWTAQSQTIMFDDFTYSGNTDPQLSAFNKWQIINGASGPPEGAQYSRNNVNFITDPGNASNKIMTLNTTVNGSTRATTHARIETSGFEYFEGTYAARVYLSDEAFNSGDGNIQTFYTIVGSGLAQDGSKYSEMDIIEYMASDKWGVSPNNRVGYITSYHKYIANPWQAWKTYNTVQRSLAGWHTFVASCTDKVNIRYYMDGVLICTHSVTDNETQAGLPVYPRSNMQVAFANWIWNNVLGSSTANRNNTMQADWVLYYKNQSLTTTEVDNLVAQYRAQGLQRRNLAGQTFYTSVVNQPPTVGIIAPANNSSFTAPANINIAANAADANGTISKVEFFNGSTLLGTDNTSPYSFAWTNVAAGTYTITAKATDNAGAATTSANITVTVANPNQAPNVNITAPASNATFTAPASINIAANATDADGTISKVEFFNGSALLGTDNSSPYSFSWTNVAAGTYSITAKATDNVGATKTSSAVAVVVNNPPATQSPYGGTPWTIPGTIEAENYDLGGQGVAFNETTTANQGGSYRTSEPIDIEPTTGGGFNLGYVVTGEWLEYTVNASAGTYTIDARVATTLADKNFRLELDGATIATINVPNTGGWQNWQTVSVSNVVLTAGQKVLRMYATTTDFNIDKITFTKVVVPSQTPYGGAAWTIPGTIDAENYDVGGQGISFNDVTNANEGAGYRADAVDIEPNPAGGFNLGYVIAGEWVEYTVNITTAGNYSIDARVAAISTGKNFRIELDGLTLGTVNVPNTGAWQTWQSVVLTNVNLTAGQKVLRIYANTSDFNVDKLIFTQSGSSARIAGSADALKQAEVNNSPNPFTDHTSFTLDVVQKGNASVKIYDKNGLLVATIFDGYLESGIYEYEFDASALKPDVYIIRYTSESGSVSKTLMKL